MTPTKLPDSPSSAKGESHWKRYRKAVEATPTDTPGRDDAIRKAKRMVRRAKEAAST